MDNQASPGLIAEHGEALWIECGHSSILFDTGQSDALLDNARALGINMSEADAIVLSHGHYDHTGGLPGVLNHTPRAVVYGHNDLARVRYSLREDHPKPIGMTDTARKALNHLAPARRYWVSAPTMICETIGLTGPIPRITAFEDPGGPFYLDPAGLQPDSIPDDQALWIRQHEGVFVCLGCCHAGLINTLQYIQTLNEGAPILAIIGGLHLVNAGLERLAATCLALDAFGLERIIACHCTGPAGLTALQTTFGARVLMGRVGMRISF